MSCGDDPDEHALNTAPKIAQDPASSMLKAQIDAADEHLAREILQDDRGLKQEMMKVATETGQARPKS